MYWGATGEKSPVLVKRRGISKELFGRTKREPALITCQTKGSIIPAYSVCLLILLLPPDPALDSSEAKTHGG